MGSLLELPKLSMVNKLVPLEEWHGPIVIYVEESEMLRGTLQKLTGVVCVFL